MKTFDSSELYYYLTEIKGYTTKDASDFVSDLNDVFDTLNHLKDNTKPLPTEEEEDCL